MAEGKGRARHRARRLRLRRSITPRLALAGLAGLVVVVVVLAVVGSGGTGTGRPGAHTPAAGAAAASAVAATAGGVPIDPGAFATGACVSFGPTAGDNHHTVFIDPGHGGVDPGGAGVTETGEVIYEDGENLAIALETSTMLRAAGFRVVLSRITSNTVARLTPADMTGAVLSPAGAVADVAARDQCANDAKATVLLGIYMDAGTSPSNAGCLTAWDPYRSFAAKSHRLATLVQTDVVSSMNAHGWQIPNDGVQPDTTLGGEPLTTTAVDYNHLILLGPSLPGWFTTPSEMPGALVEPLFLTDPFEGSIANSAAGHQAVAKGLTEAIEQYFA